MSNSPQSRQPAGASEGGQFTAGVRTEPELDLAHAPTWDRDLDHDDTFEYDHLRTGKYADGDQVVRILRRTPARPGVAAGAWETTDLARIPVGARAEFCTGNPDDDCLDGSCPHCWSRPIGADLDWMRSDYPDEVDAYEATH